MIIDTLTHPKTPILDKFSQLCADIREIQEEERQEELRQARRDKITENEPTDDYWERRAEISE